MSYQTAIQPQKQSETAISMTRGILQRKCACGQHTVAGGECAECRKKRLQRKATGHTGPETVPPIVHEVLRSLGQPLDAKTRAFMEPRFGHDFSQVRVHTNARAAESVRAVNALAYTVGRDVVFGAGQYAPGTSEGRRLMAHELTHVVQQRGETILDKLSISDPFTAYEQEAQWNAEMISTRRPNTSSVSSADPVIARQELPGPMSLPEQPPMTMGPTAPSLRGMVAMSIALGEVGIREVPSGSNRGPCAGGATRGCVDAYTGGRDQPWCAHFVSWCFEQTGFSPFGHLASVNGLRSWGRSQGWYVERSAVARGEFTPLAGDIFTKPRYEGVGPQRRLVGGHTGFVIRYDPASHLLETVEGNTGDRVQMRTRSLGDLDGFIRVGS
jgi:hypothetical protein